MPRGRLDPGETPEECLLREIREECNLIGVVGQLVDVWVYEVLPKKQVLIVTYVCECSDLAPFTLSDEHTEYGWFNRNEWENLPMPEGYKHIHCKDATFVLTKNLITRQTKTGNVMYGISGFGLERIVSGYHLGKNFGGQSLFYTLRRLPLAESLPYSE